MKKGWYLALFAVLVAVVCGTYPQLKMWYVRGADWQGAYAYNDIDEVAYAAYLGALIDGKPRKNDPYTGRDDAPEHPQEESLFSIQFAAPYSVAIPARIFGLNVNTAMWVSGGVAAAIAALALFWLIRKFTDDPYLAMAGALVVICGGALFAGEGALGEVWGGGFSYPYFPGLRRYVPAMPFAVFFILCGLIWVLIKTESQKHRLFISALSVLCFAYMVFSYFFIWTTAAAWLGVLVLIWLIARPEGWRNDFRHYLVLGTGCVLSLAPYAYLLSKRSHTMDDVQLLVNTHAPDLWRYPQPICYVVILLLVLSAVLKLVNFRDPKFLFALSLALTPIIVINQQVITGHSLQPIHYQVFIGNYVAALSLVLTLGIIWRPVMEQKPKVSNAVFSVLALIAAAWGIVECHYTVRVLDEANLARDEGMPVARRLKELSVDDVPASRSSRAVTLAYSHIQADDLPTIAPQSILWARHQHVFAGVTWQENKERYYQYLYYSGLDAEWLEKSLKEGDFVSMIALFGWGRHTGRLSTDAKPLTFGEIEEEAAKFGEYIKNFEAAKSPETVLSYVVVPKDWNMDFENLDKWYERDTGETFSDSVLYKVKLRK